MRKKLQLPDKPITTEANENIENESPFEMAPLPKVDFGLQTKGNTLNTNEITQEVLLLPSELNQLLETRSKILEELVSGITKIKKNPILTTHRSRQGKNISKKSLNKKKMMKI